MTAAESTHRVSAIHPVTLRWHAMVDEHGSQVAALAALFKQVDELERLKHAVLSQGQSPEILASVAHGASL